MVVVGESGAGKTAFVEHFLAERAGRVRTLSAVCDPLTPPRPLGPIRDVAHGVGEQSRRMLSDAEHAVDIFDALFADLGATPTVLVIDDLQWADQGTIDMLRFVLRRIHRCPLLVVGVAREDEVHPAHPMRTLLADVARSASAHLVSLEPLTLDGVRELAGEQTIDTAWLHRITGGNAFFVTEMLDHPTGDLPTTVRDAVLGRTVGLDAEAWDLLNLLSCSPEAIPDLLLPASRCHATDAAAASRRASHSPEQPRRGVPARPVPAGGDQCHAARRRTASAPSHARRLRGVRSHRPGRHDAPRAPRRRPATDPAVGDGGRANRGALRSAPAGRRVLPHCNGIRGRPVRRRPKPNCSNCSPRSTTSPTSSTRPSTLASGR